MSRRIAAAKPAAPSPSTWQEWLAVFRADPEIAALDESMRYFPELVAKMKCDCLQQRRGWVMMGRPGAGKTRRAAIISKLLSIPMRSARDMVLEICSTKITTESIRAIAGLGTCRITGRAREQDLIIDDLGIELPRATFFGTPIDPMSEMLSIRLDLWPHVRTYITTNLEQAALAERYGERIWSRLNEQMIFLPFCHVDHRFNNSASNPPGQVSGIPITQKSCDKDDGKANTEGGMPGGS